MGAWAPRSTCGGSGLTERKGTLGKGRIDGALAPEKAGIASKPPRRVIDGGWLGHGHGYGYERALL